MAGAKLERTKYPGIHRRGDRYAYEWTDASGKRRRGAARTLDEARAGKARREDESRHDDTVEAQVLDRLYTAVSALHRGAAALKAENAELRAAAAMAPAAEDAPGRPGLEMRLPLDRRAPRAARTAVAGHVRDRVGASVLADAELVASELVTNSVVHSGASADATVRIRVELTPTTVRLEVADPGRSGLIAPRDADLDAGHGFGLNVVQSLSRSWGVERMADTGTRAWAEIPRSPLATARS